MATTKQAKRSVVQHNADVPDQMVTKMGRALAEIAQLEQELADRVDTVESEADKQQLAEQADRAITDAVTDQGLTITQFNQVVRAADEDPALRDRITAAIRAA
jgi:hypothetical protein